MKHGNKPLLQAALSVFWPHVGGLLVVLILSFALPSFLIGGGLWLTIPLFLIAYSLAMYASAWRVGHEDMNSANFGHSVLDRKRGFWIGLVANSLNILSGIFLLLNYILYSLQMVDFSFIIPFKMLNAEIWPIMNAIESSAFLSALSLWQVVIFALLPLIPVAICGVSYILGTRDFSILQKVVYKNKKAKANAADTGMNYRAKKAGATDSHVWEPVSTPETEKEKKPSLLHKILYENEETKK